MIQQDPICIRLFSMISNAYGQIIEGQEVEIRVEGKPDMCLKLYHDAGAWYLWTNQRFGQVYKNADNSVMVKWYKYGEEETSE